MEGRITQLLKGMLWVGLLLGCASPGVGQTIERVTVGETSDADQLNPFTNFSATGSYINEYLFGSFLRTDKSTGEFLPVLAMDLPQISDDKLSYTYTLHPLAKFNNGKKVTARDVVFSIKALRNPYVNNSQKRAQYEMIQDAVALTEQMVVITMTKPHAQSLRITGEFAVMSEDFFDPEHAMEQISLGEEGSSGAGGLEKTKTLRTIAERVNLFGSSFAAFNADPLCGPYVLQDWKRGSLIVLEANKRFWGRKLEPLPNDFFKQNVGEIRFEIIADESMLRKAIFDGHLDLVSSLPPSLFENLSQIPALAAKYSFQAPPGPSYEYIGMNMRPATRNRNAATSDLAVRKALARLVHVDLLMVQVCSGQGTRIASEFPVSRPDYRNEDLPLIPFDLQEAAQILDQAGWVDSDNNGLRDKAIDGQDVQMVLECIYNDTRTDRRIIAEHLAENALKLGILVTLTPLPWKDYLARLKSGDFEIAAGGWTADPNEDSYRQIWHTKSWGTGSNFVGFGSKTTDSKIEEYDQTFGNDRHRALSQEMQKLIYDEQPYVFLWSNNKCLMVSKRLEEVPIYNLRPGFWIAAW